MYMKIGLVGAPGAGKDVLADFLVQNKGFTKLAFADKIKEKYYDSTGFTEKVFKSSRDTYVEEKIRKGLWDYSDKMRKKFGDLYFITPVINNVVNYPGPIVVSDIRTRQEFDEMKKIGANIIFVVRDSTKITSPIPGTRIDLDWLMGHQVFWNYYEDLDSAHQALEKFYKILKGENMKSDKPQLGKGT